MLYRDTIQPFMYSRTLGRTAILAVALGVYSLFPLLKEHSSYRNIGNVPSNMHAALSLILGCLLVFRTNSAYARWWEARTLWGNLVNASRNLSIKLSQLVQLTPSDAALLQSKMTEFPRQLMKHLRLPSQATDHPISADPIHAPRQTVQDIYAWVGQQRQRKIIDGEELRVIDVELAKLLEVCGGCERIARTPFVLSYRIFARQCVILFLLSFPWGVAHDFLWWTIPLTMIIGYFMIGMEIVAEHVEEPFGNDEDDLDLDGMCDIIEQSVRAAFQAPGIQRG